MHTGPASESQKVVLVVDDDPTLRVMMVKALSSKYKVYEAEDGIAASELLGHIAPPDLIVCDVMMPRVDGFSFVKMIKADTKFKNVPVLFLTARAAAADVARGINLGAKQYLTKPFKVVDLLDKVAKAIR